MNVLFAYILEVLDTHFQYEEKDFLGSLPMIKCRMYIKANLN